MPTKLDSTEAIAFERPPFGQFIRQVASLRLDDLAGCLAYQRTHGGKLGEILVQHALVTPQQVLDALKLQARWVARSIRADMTHEGLPYAACLSLCLPAYNEAENIRDTLGAACAILPEFVQGFEIIVVNDGSSDATAAVVEEYQRRDARVRLVQHEQNRGYGAAVTSGLRAARGDLVMFTDSDGQFSMLDLPQLLRHLPHYDFVIGYRHPRADKRMRIVNAWCWNRLVRAMLSVRVRDLDGAYKLFRRDLIERLQLTSHGACINAEIMAQCVRGNLRFAEVPVHHYPRYRGAATGANWKVIAKAFRELPDLWKYRRAPAPLPPVADASTAVPHHAAA